MREPISSEWMHSVIRDVKQLIVDRIAESKTPIAPSEAYEVVSNALHERSNNLNKSREVNHNGRT